MMTQYLADIDGLDSVYVTYGAFPLDIGDFSLWILSLMLRYYQFKKEYTLYPACYIFTDQSHCFLH